MKAVVNATPLIALALLDRLSLLNEMFDEVIVPRAVYAEVVQGGAGKPGADALAEVDLLKVVSADVTLTNLCCLAWMLGSWRFYCWRGKSRQTGSS